MNGYGYSWLQSDGRLFWARSKHPLDSPQFCSESESSVTRLIAGLYRLDPRWARKRVRNRIYSTEPLSESAWGTVKVAARRVVFSVPDFEGGFPIDAVELSGEHSTADSALEPGVSQKLMGLRLSDAGDIWAFLDGLILQGQEDLGMTLSLPVSAVLLDTEGRVLSWGVNSAWDFRTEHAETNLIQRWRRAGSPGVPASLWVTRKCCKMCAGWIWDTWLKDKPEGSVLIRFREPDNGPLARLTVLDTGSFENLRARLIPKA
ncbi:hypothetical protein EBZ37_06490 [bacterium]|nr:hypothetical protein [bacterium]